MVPFVSSDVSDLRDPKWVLMCSDQRTGCFAVATAQDLTTGNALGWLPSVLAKWSLDVSDSSFSSGHLPSLVKTGSNTQFSCWPLASGVQHRVSEPTPRDTSQRSSSSSNQQPPPPRDHRPTTCRDKDASAVLARLCRNPSYLEEPHIAILRGS